MFVLDFVFESINTYGINKLKDLVDKTNSVNIENTNTTDTNQVDNSEVVANETSNEVTKSEDANSVEE